MAKNDKQFVKPFEASEGVLSDGRVAVPGEPVTLDTQALDDPHNKRLVDEGQLIEVTQSGGEK